MRFNILFLQGSKYTSKNSPHRIISWTGSFQSAQWLIIAGIKASVTLAEVQSPSEHPLASWYLHDMCQKEVGGDFIRFLVFFRSLRLKDTKSLRIQRRETRRESLVHSRHKNGFRNPALIKSDEWFELVVSWINKFKSSPVTDGEKSIYSRCPSLYLQHLTYIRRLSNTLAVTSVSLLKFEI